MQKFRLIGLKEEKGRHIFNLSPESWKIIKCANVNVTHIYAQNRLIGSEM